MAASNPYLAYRLAKSKSKTTNKADSPDVQVTPRKISHSRLDEALNGRSNPFTEKLYSSQYHTILEARKNLPVYQQKAEFLKLFSENQVLIVEGETGSGKSTQIPQFVAHFNQPHTGKKIACTQPLEIAAMSLARRVAAEMDVELGQEVGYSIRFDDMTTPDVTFLKYMTDGILLHEAMSDPKLAQYGTIIIDEAHERSCATDIIMGLLKSLVQERTDLKVVILSAANTTDIKLQKYFGLQRSLGDRKPPPLFTVPGSRYPVQVFYTKEPEPDYLAAAIRTVTMIHRNEENGDILLFLAEEAEIEEACERLRQAMLELHDEDPLLVGAMICIPLYASLPPSAQQRVFDPLPGHRSASDAPPRKCVVATNIAESSLIFDGVVYVVDPGFSQQRVYNPRIRVDSYLVSPISKESARQRAGRAGRTRPGKCFRLYTERDFVRELEETNLPEILRCNLSTAVLQLIVLGVKDLVRFNWVDAPLPETLMRALELLNYLAAVDDDGNLTALGKVMGDFPLEPQLAKVLIASPDFECSNEILTIASMLSVPNIWLRSRKNLREADAAKAPLSHPDGDHLTLLNVYNQYVDNLHDTNWAWTHYLSILSLHQAQKFRSQLVQIMERHDIELLSASTQKQSLSVRQALVCGFFMQVAHRVGERYETVKDTQITYFHPSCVVENRPEWVIFNEFILTTQPYLRTVTPVEPEWSVHPFTIEVSAS
ncbi:P-loop containing nucleoside triphosphate hydrolase protein [Mycena amicta]|nr:P-loop containing nucleoside triphosphate hydrolase protein [Mycena amicta]